MSEDYIEVIDFNKIALVVGLISIPIFFGVLFYAGLIPVDISKISLPEIDLPVGQDSSINENYQKFLEFGLAKQDVLWYQNYSCVELQYENGTGLQDNGKFGAIYTQKLLDCGLG